jgi:TonB-dependent SusC/RagA subfamily outer membrane receptor
MSTSGDPDATTSIRIRGTRSITASNDPLIVVDGVMDAVSDLNDINPADIESISILKDASSTAIYGARGSNGVILITTKEAGRTSSVSITAKLIGGVSMLPSKLDLMDAAQFANYRNEYAQLSSTNENFTTESPISQGTVSDPYSLGKGTDWIEEITRVAPYQSQQISGSCTVGSSKHYASFSHYDNRGIIKNSGVRNMVARINSSVELFN